MVKVGLFVRLHAKPGKENELASLLSGGLSVVQEEAGTPLWFAVRFDASTFAIFDAFNDENPRPRRFDRVTIYFGQCVIEEENENGSQQSS